MKFRIQILTAIICFTSFSYALSSNGNQIEEGVLNLELVDISEIKSIKLEGNWEFYWNQLLEPQDFKNENITPDLYGKVPKPWTKYMVDSANIPYQGFATYRLVINKKADTVETIYGLKVSTVFSNYKLWVNGKFITEVGKVSTTKELTDPKFTYQDIPFVLDPDKESTENIEIIFQVSNFSHRRAGLQKPIFFGTYNTIRSQTRSKDILNLIIIGIILIIGINHLNMYLFRRKAISNLYFGIISIVMILRNITTGDRIITYIFPNINWELLVKLDNFSGFGTIPLFALFIYSLYKVDFPKVMFKLMLVIGVIVTLLVFATPANFYGKFRLFFEMYIGLFGLYLTFGVLMISAIRRRPFAFYAFVGMFILYATAINDLLSSMGVVQSAYVAPYGLAVFMLIQSITITVKSAKAINENENLGDELRLEKENLEKNINARTHELQKQHDELLVHQEKEKQQAWINNGVANVNDILADNKDDFKALASKVLSELIKYIKATSGVLYMLNSEDESNDFLELIADYGCSNEIRKGKSKIYTTTGNLGVAYSENRVMVINDVPENYIKIESGLGNSNPKALMIVPLSIDEKVFGIIELASFNKLSQLEIEFIKRVANNIAANLNNIRMNENSAGMIKKFQEQTLLMQEKEEEMRQNLEEMEAIREQYDELRKKNNM
jgi:7TM diverse intracellular signalling/GAF domain